MGVRGCQTATKRNSKPNKAMKTSAPRRTKSISLHTLSYHDDWDSGCWNRGLALPRIGEHAMYLNLSAGASTLPSYVIWGEAAPPPLLPSQVAVASGS
jgi:hypothetical protein